MGKAQPGVLHRQPQLPCSAQPVPGMEPRTQSQPLHAGLASGACCADPTLLLRAVGLTALLNNLALPRELQGCTNYSCPPWRDVHTPWVLLVSPGMVGLCPQGRSSQKVDGPVGDDLIVVIGQSPLASLAAGALLSTKPRKGWWDQRAGEKPSLGSKSCPCPGGFPLAEAQLGLQPGSSQDPRAQEELVPAGP